MTRAAKEQSTYCAVRREGPQNVAEAGEMGLWPMTHVDSWCGEYDPPKSEGSS